jgi:hypothetical protein
VEGARQAQLERPLRQFFVRKRLLGRYFAQQSLEHIGLQVHLAEQNGQQSGEKLSKATLYATLAQLKRFFQWLAGQPGYKSRFQYSDAEYFNLSDKETRIATAQREQKRRLWNRSSTSSICCRPARR